MLKVVGLALSLILCAAACNGILGNTEASGTDDHLFDPSGIDGSAEGDGGDGGDTFDAPDLDGATPLDAGPDVVVDAAALNCGSPALVNSCLDCPGKTFLCDGGCVASCRGGCGFFGPVECIGCNAAGVPDIAVCESGMSPAACIAGHKRCPCGGGAMDCPGPNQVCNGGMCAGCGEGMTDTVACKTGGQCDNQLDVGRYTCH